MANFRIGSIRWHIECALPAHVLAPHFERTCFVCVCKGSQAIVVYRWYCHFHFFFCGIFVSEVRDDVNRVVIVTLSKIVMMRFQLAEIPVMGVVVAVNVELHFMQSVYQDAVLLEATLLDKHVLLKKRRDALEGLQSCVAGNTISLSIIPSTQSLAQHSVHHKDLAFLDVVIVFHILDHGFSGLQVLLRVSESPNLSLWSAAFDQFNPADTFIWDGLATASVLRYVDTC
ncbi:hypothetical protein Nepgr_001816 [Nepenthes gracilis]|uniref:Uncharacterized protein n=1 Tax=Nepenthes gracilis TaxID=150966 RepID=A0AAD3P959_NEPGR|nr:hypothetical protein Nepgr_001816 [Nepenthes gracilis]